MYLKLRTIEWRFGPNGNKYSFCFHGDDLFPTAVKEKTDNPQKSTAYILNGSYIVYLINQDMR